MRHLCSSQVLKSVSQKGKGLVFTSPFDKTMPAFNATLFEPSLGEILAGPSCTFKKLPTPCPVRPSISHVNALKPKRQTSAMRIIQSISPQRRPGQDIQLEPRRPLRKQRSINRNVAFQNESIGSNDFRRRRPKM